MSKACTVGPESVRMIELGHPWIIADSYTKKWQGEAGDLVELDVEKRELNLKVSPAELAQRKSAWKAPARKYERSYGAIFARHVKQADEGCDFDFLEGTAPVPEPEIH